MKKNENGRWNERQLKVYPKYFNRETTLMPNIFPEIRLCGKWLKEIGFTHGQTVIVRHGKKKIVIIPQQ